MFIPPPPPKKYIKNYVCPCNYTYTGMSYNCIKLIDTNLSWIINLIHIELFFKECNNWLFINVKFLVAEEKFLKELLYIHNMIQKVPPSHKNPDPKAMNFTILVNACFISKLSLSCLKKSCKFYTRSLDPILPSMDASFGQDNHCNFQRKIWNC